MVALFHLGENMKGILSSIKELLCNLAGCNKAKRRAHSVRENRVQKVAREFAIPSHMHPTGTTIKLGDSVRPIFLCNGSRKLPHVLTEQGCYVPVTWK
jgi:hypothetical protein